MFLKVNELKDVCSNILPAVDSTELSLLSETLEIEAHRGELKLSVTNREYFVTVKLKCGDEEEFKATVNASLFLRLVAQTTADTIELNINDTNLCIKGNGTYKIPLVFENNSLLELPRIDINNVTAQFEISSTILNSILDYNSKQISIGTLSRPVQKLYYVDEKGALTFTSGACINKFTLEQPIKMLLNQRLVKLFKLFKSGNVNFMLGYDSPSPDIVQTKVRFENDNISITAILSSDESLISSVPVTAIRSRANNMYPYSVTLDRRKLIETIDRMKLFVTGMNNVVSYAKFDFNKDFVAISDATSENTESIYYNNDASNIENYIMYLDLNEFSAVLDTCAESHVVINFGDNQAITVCRGNVINVVPEVNVEGN